MDDPFSRRHISRYRKNEIGSTASNVNSEHKYEAYMYVRVPVDVAAHVVEAIDVRGELTHFRLGCGVRSTVSVRRRADGRANITPLKVLMKQRGQ